MARRRSVNNDDDDLKESLLPQDPETDFKSKRQPRRCPKRITFIMVGSILLAAAGAVAFWPTAAEAQSCDNFFTGYQCSNDVSHNWGQYSPYFSVGSSIPNFTPPGCQISFVNVLSRHGARSPTSSKTTAYNQTIQQIQNNVKTYNGKYAFLQSYAYNLGADSLTTFGQQEMVNSGIKFYTRYEELSRKYVPFTRAASEQRVVESGQNFSQGYHNARQRDPLGSKNDGYPYPYVSILEASGSNNTLNHDLCTNFETGPNSKIASNAQNTWANIFIPPIQNRLNNDLPGANLSITQTIYMLDLCPFDTVKNDNGAISPFCKLFTQQEFVQYSYYESLNKYYGYGAGNPLGPTQGVGFSNELIARMTNKSVVDNTSTNRTLDSDPATFPLGLPLYADFSHDNDMTTIFFALGLYNTTAPLSNTTVQSTDQTNGYSAAYTVPFAARAYFEKMRCFGQREELVRVLVNDRVVSLQNCGADQLGRCRLSKWVDSLTFPRSNGHWDQCFS